MDVLTAPSHEKERVQDWAIAQFSSWGYYRMFPFPNLARKMIDYWIEQAESGKDKALLKILLTYEMAVES